MLNDILGTDKIKKFQANEDDINDIQLFIKTYKNDQEFMNEILSSFIDEVSERMGNLETAVSQKDAKAIAYAAHKFIAIFSSVYIDSASKISHELQNAARSNDIPLCENLFNDLQNKMFEIISYIQSVMVEI